MPILSKFRDFLHRHRNKFVVGGILITGTILLTRYAQQKLREWQERETRDFLERTRRQQHFESTERTCNQTVVNLIPTLIEAITKAMNTEEIIESLKMNPENKVELWERLKVMVFTRTSCLVYLTAMLVVTLRVQLNVIGGYLFRNPTSISSEVQQRYLTLIQNLFNGGMTSLSALIEKELLEIIGPVPLKKQLKLTDLENIFWALQTSVATSNCSPIERLREFILFDGIPEGDDIYSIMVRDTADLLDSEEVKSIMTHCISRNFVALGDLISEYYIPNGTKKGDGDSRADTFVHPSHVGIHMAKLIPVINGLFSKSLPNALVQQLMCNEKLKTLGANVYECFSHSLG